MTYGEKIRDEESMYILALDQGTTSSRAVLVDKKGKIVSSEQKEFPQIFPKPGLVEHDPEQIYQSQIEVAKKAIDSCCKPKDIQAIGITNQRETTVVWNRKTSKPICNAIVWQDRRTAPICEMLKKYEKLFQKKTGLLMDPYFSGTKIHWILENIEGARELAQKKELAFGTIDSWLIWKLTKLHITDVTNASRTLLFNIHTLSWDDELLDILNIPKSLLPEVRSSSEVYGKTSVFSGSIPITGIAGDQQAALFAQCCFKKGTAKITYGTGCFMLMQMGKDPILSKNHLLTSIAWQIKDQVNYVLEGSVFNAGTVIKWLKDNLGIVNSYKEFDQLVESTPSTEGVYFVPAFTGLGAPYWDPYIRGMILGLSRGTTAAHIARAALDGIAFQGYDVLKAMVQDTNIFLREIRVDGGVSVSDCLMQKQSDVIQTKILRPKIKETTAMGAAYLAGLAIGFWKDQEELIQLWQLEKEFTPQISQEKAKQKVDNWAKAIICAQRGEEIL